MLSTTDPAGNTTTYDYTDHFSSGGPTGGVSNAYLTKITHPPTPNAAHVEQYRYDFATGELTSSIDQNLQTTSYVYNDPLNRLKETDFPDGGESLINYTDTKHAVSVETMNKLDSSRWTDAYDSYDGLGNLVAHTSTNGETTPYDRVDTCYNGHAQQSFVSYPYQIGSNLAAPNCTSGIGDTYSYDALGRAQQVTHNDGSYVATTYVGRSTRTQDEGNGAHNITRISQVNGLGLPIWICEVTQDVPQMGISPSNCGLGFSDKGFLTHYLYDPLGNLTAVNQVNLNQRSFAYDFASRLTTATNPESGSVTYVYDSDGNCPMPHLFSGDLVSKTDARSVRTCMQYDALHRLIQKNYSDTQTPTVSYNYDESSSHGVGLQYTVGRISSESTAVSNLTAEVFSYDKLGRVTDNSQCTPQNCGTSMFSITYPSPDLLGDVTAATNGMGVTLYYSYNVAARLTGMTSSLSNAGHPSPLLSNVSYNGFGSPLSASLGNGISESFGYFPRGWLQSLQDGGASTPGIGTVTVSGSEQSQPGAGITPGTGSVVIGGSEQSVQIFTCSMPVKPPAGTQQQVQPNGGGGGCYKTVYDTGWVSITVNAFTKTVNYGQYSSDTTIANAFTAAFNGDSNSPVTASNTGATVYLTSKALGTAANYTLSSSANTNDPTDFGGSSFYGTPSGSTLTGGTNGPPTYDSGTVTVTVNGFQAPVSYGQSSTPSSIASSLATALSVSSSPVMATANGAVVTLTSKATGSSSNYSLSASVTGSFNPVSFAASPSGSSLTGGGSTGVAYSASFPTGNGNGYAPNGDVLNVTDSVNGTWSYAYDDMNRLNCANQSNGPCSNPTSGTATYTYAYDPYGNRWSQSGPNTMSLIFTSTNNQIAQHCSGNSGPAYTYDASGEMTSDCINTYTYDAEGRIASVVNTFTGATASYVYNAEGQRVRKTVNGVSVDYLYDTGGHQIAEVNSSGGWNRGEVYAGGAHLATYVGGISGTTYFIHADWLGTERARSNVSAAACETITSLPFGDGQAVSGTCGDPSLLHFTSQIRDSETASAAGGQNGLDYFNARFNSSSLGRFLSPDPANAGADLSNPQSWNGYAYALNNPLSYTDPTGLYCEYYVNNFGDETDVEAVDANSTPGECGNTGGNWFDPVATYVFVTADAPNGMPVGTTGGPSLTQPSFNPSPTASPSASPAANHNVSLCTGALLFIGGYVGASVGSDLGAFGGGLAGVLASDEAPPFSNAGGGVLGAGTGVVVGGVLGGAYGISVGYQASIVMCSQGGGGGGGGTPKDNKKADDLIPGSQKRSPSYHSEYGQKTYGEIKELAKAGDQRAQQMKKLIEQAGRLGQRNY